MKGIFNAVRLHNEGSDGHNEGSDDQILTPGNFRLELPKRQFVASDPSCVDLICSWERNFESSR